MWHPLDLPWKRGAFWLDVLCARLGLLCSSCGWWKWESPCHAQPHWREKA